MDREQMRQRMLWYAMPFIAAMLLLALAVSEPALAIFGRGEELRSAAPGAPIARNMEVRAYRNVPYTGKLSALDCEGDEVDFSIVDQPTKGSVVLDGDTFVYTPEQDRSGADKFTYCAVDAAGNVSESATVKITVARSDASHVYADMQDNAAYTAAVDLAEHGVFLGVQVGGERFFEPERSVKRSEFVAMALRSVALEAAEVTVTGFSDDADIPTWAKGYAVSALSHGVIRGVATEEGPAFCAERAITLNEAATVLNRLLRITDVNLSDYDELAADAWSAQAVANLQSVSVLESGRFSAEDLSRPLTRAEAAELLSATMALAGTKTQGGLLRAIFG